MSEHEPYIRRAIQLAHQAKNNGNHPFGALLVSDNKVVLEAENTVLIKGNPTFHAELNLMQEAWEQLPPNVIHNATLYTSTEPCPMCTGAIFWSSVRRIVFSFSAIELGQLTGGKFSTGCRELFDRADQKTEVIGPVLPELGKEVHIGFWR